MLLGGVGKYIGRMHYPYAFISGIVTGEQGAGLTSSVVTLPANNNGRIIYVFFALRVGGTSLIYPPGGWVSRGYNSPGATVLMEVFSLRPSSELTTVTVSHSAHNTAWIACVFECARMVSTSYGTDFASLSTIPPASYSADFTIPGSTAERLGLGFVAWGGTADVAAYPADAPLYRTKLTTINSAGIGMALFGKVAQKHTPVTFNDLTLTAAMSGCKVTHALSNIA